MDDAWSHLGVLSIRKNATNRPELVRASMFQVESFLLQVLSLTTVTRCGGYLHDANLVHEDIKPVCALSSLGMPAVF